jgi:hypothetical protein
MFAYSCGFTFTDGWRSWRVWISNLACWIHVILLGKLCQVIMSILTVNCYLRVEAVHMICMHQLVQTRDHTDQWKSAGRSLQESICFEFYGLFESNEVLFSVCSICIGLWWCKTNMHKKKFTCRQLCMSELCGYSVKISGQRNIVKINNPI